MFELFDGAGNKIGQLMYVEVKSDWYGVLRDGKASTPWGDTCVIKETLTLALAGLMNIVTGDRVLATIRGHDISFPGKAVLSFKVHHGLTLRTFAMTYTGDTGSVTVTENIGKDTMTDSSLGATHAADNPDSLTTNSGAKTQMSERYDEWVIRASGILPVDDDDIMHGLVMALSFNMLQFAQNPKAAPVGF